MYETVRKKIVPPLFILFFTPITRVLVVLGNPELKLDDINLLSLGSPFAWKVVLIFFLWAFLSLKIPWSKKFYGPPPPSEAVVAPPAYVANGKSFYVLSILTFSVLTFYFPSLCTDIYEDFGSIVAVLNIIALLLVTWLMVTGNKSEDENLIYLFYRGKELHPRFLGVDLKQWTNCRIGMMGWALLVIVFAVASVRINGFTPGPVVTAILINVYLFKFFVWETGYFNTLDITLDRAGYYLIWGCLCWVQAFYTFLSYYMVGHPDFEAGALESLAILASGHIFILLNYACDRQKELFKATNGRCIIWGRPAKYLQVEYRNQEGKRKKSHLLLSGFWGISRHMNYVFEILLSLAWSLPALRLGPLPFMYVGFLAILLIHRTFRDDEKCSQKYGDGWKQYCRKVPYKMIPYVF